MRQKAGVPIIDCAELVVTLQRQLPAASIAAETINADYKSWEISVRDGHSRVNIAWGPLSGFGVTDLNNLREDISPFLSHDWPMESADAAIDFVVRVVRGSAP